MELQQIIYTALTGSTDVVGFTGNRIFHKHLPVDFKANVINTVFILNVNASEGSFDDYNEIEFWNMDIKLNYLTSAELFAYAEIIKELVKNINNSKIKYVEYLDDNLVWNQNYGFYNLNLRFSIHYSKN